MAIEALLQRQRDFRPQPLLSLQPLGILLRKPRQFAQPEDHAVLWAVRNVASAMERQQRLLACGREIDVPHQDHALIAVVHYGLMEQRGAEGAAEKGAVAGSR